MSELNASVRVLTAHVPLGRFAQPDDIAQAVAFLADERRSGYVNGAALSVDGGWHVDGSWPGVHLGPWRGPYLDFSQRLIRAAQAALSTSVVVRRVGWLAAPLRRASARRRATSSPKRNGLVR